MPIDWNPMSALGAARLLIQTDKYLDGKQAQVSATLRIQTAAGLWRKRFTLRIGQNAVTTLEVPPGDFSVQAVLPSGETISDDGSVEKDKQKEVVLAGRHSRHEWLSWASYALDADYLQQPPPAASAQAGFESVDEPVSMRPRLDEVWSWPGSFPCWAVVWDRQRSEPTPAEFLPAIVSPYSTHGDEESFAARFSLASSRAAFPPDAILHSVVAEVPVAGGESIYCTLPLDWETREGENADSLLVVDLAPQAVNPATGRPMLRARATVQDSDLAQLVGYQRRGESEALKEVGVQIADVAEKLLEQKSSNPLLAAAAALALLNMRESARMHDWTRNLANWFPWLPDGPIIRAWHLLYQQDRERSRRVSDVGVPDEPRAWLLEAARRGLPVYTESLRLLVQGLRAFPTRGEDQAQRDTARALQFYESLLWRTQSQQGFTSVLAPQGSPPRFLVQEVGKPPVPAGSRR